MNSRERQEQEAARHGKPVRESSRRATPAVSASAALTTTRTGTLPPAVTAQKAPDRWTNPYHVWTQAEVDADPLTVCKRWATGEVVLLGPGVTLEGACAFTRAPEIPPPSTTPPPPPPPPPPASSGGGGGGGGGGDGYWFYPPDYWASVPPTTGLVEPSLESIFSGYRAPPRRTGAAAPASTLSSLWPWLAGGALIAFGSGFLTGRRVKTIAKQVGIAL